MQTSVLRTTGLVALLLVLSACGGDVDEEPVVESKEGSVTFGVSIDAKGGYVNKAYGVFTTQGLTSPGCTTSNEGACTLSVCQGSGGVRDSLSAGTITISGGFVTPVALSYGSRFDPMAYDSTALPTNQPVLVGGEQITVTAKGGDVPAFTLTGKAPVSPTITGLPEADAGAPIDIDASKDLVLTLQGGDEGIVLFSLLATEGPGGRGAQLTCRVPATASSLTVPASGMATLRSYSGLAQVSSSVISMQTGQAGEYRVGVVLSNALKKPDGSFLRDETSLNLR